MSVSPTGYTGSILTKARAMLAASATFRARVGAADATAALASIQSVLAFGENIALARPYAVVCPAIDAPPTWERVSSYGAGSMRPLGNVDIVLCDDAKHMESDHDSFIDFVNFLDGVTKDIADLNAVGDYLALNTIERPQEALATRPDSEEDGGRCSWEAVIRLVVAR